MDGLQPRFPTAILWTGSEKGDLGFESFPCVGAGSLRCLGAALKPDAAVVFPLLAEGPLLGGEGEGWGVSTWQADSRESVYPFSPDSPYLRRSSYVTHANQELLCNYAICKKRVCKAACMGRGVFRYHYRSGWMRCRCSEFYQIQTT